MKNSGILIKTAISAIILILIVTNSYGQLTDDSLKKAIGIRYEQLTYGTSLSEIDEKRLYGNSSEVFADYFPGIKVFDFRAGVVWKPNHFTTCDDCRRVFFAVDAATGLPANIKDPSNFNRQMARSKLHFTYADKAYIYLLLNGLTNHSLPAAPQQYNKGLFKASLFPINNMSLWHFNKFKSEIDGIKYDERRQHYIDISDHRTFYIPVLETQENYQITIHRFDFDMHGNLFDHSSFVLE